MKHPQSASRRGPSSLRLHSREVGGGGVCDSQLCAVTMQSSHHLPMGSGLAPGSCQPDLKEVAVGAQAVADCSWSGGEEAGLYRALPACLPMQRVPPGLQLLFLLH